MSKVTISYNGETREMDAAATIEKYQALLAERSLLDARRRDIGEELSKTRQEFEADWRNMLSIVGDVDIFNQHLE